MVKVDSADEFFFDLHWISQHFDEILHHEGPHSAEGEAAGPL